MAHYAEAATLSSTLSITLSFIPNGVSEGQSDGQSGTNGPLRKMRIAGSDRASLAAAPHNALSSARLVEHANTTYEIGINPGRRASCSTVAFAADLRIGIIGCDTSHVTAFTEVLNNPQAKGHVPGGKVVAAYKGGSPDIPSSINRVEEYATTLRDKYGVKMCDTIEALCTMWTSCCWRAWMEGRTSSS